ncbi:MAG TPA: hypothetical protein VFL80_12520, partial [Thermoanaerobaculia bacterium]|nr:hypothetical protein [Thermoanaerobaculia bacterium]
YVQPDKVSILVVGNEKEFDKPLASMGTVTPIDITIPEPGAAPKPAAGASAAPAAPAASSAEGLALLRKVQQFVGGKAKIDAVKSTRMTMMITAKTPQGEMEIESERVDRYPDARREVMKTPMGEMTTVITPTVGFMASPMGSQDLPSSRRDSAVGDMRFDVLNVLRNAEKEGYTVTVAGTEKIGDVNAQILQISIGGSPVKWWIDPATGRLLRTSRQGRMGEQVVEITHWKEFGGINFPVAANQSAGGQQQASIRVTSIEVNPTLDPALFEKPAAK